MRSGFREGIISLCRELDVLKLGVYSAAVVSLQELWRGDALRCCPVGPAVLLTNAALCCWVSRLCGLEPRALVQKLHTPLV